LFSPAIGCVDYDWAIKSHIYRQLTQIVRSWQVFNSFLLQKAVCGIMFLKANWFDRLPAD